MWNVVLDNEIRILEVLYIFDVAPRPMQFRERPWFAFELKLKGLDVIPINMGIPELDDELTCSRTRDLGNHMCEKGIGGDVEWNPQSEIGRPLEHQARKFGLSGRI